MTPEIQSDLFADGGGPGPPLVLNGCEAGQQRHRAGSETMISAGVCMTYLAYPKLRTQNAHFVCAKEMKNDWL